MRRISLNDPHRYVQPEALNVAPHLVGAALATPLRRAWALGVDLLVVALLSGVGGLWLVVGLVLVAAQLHIRREQAGGEAPLTPARSRRRVQVGWVVAAVLLLLAAGEAQDRWTNWRHPERAAAEAAADAAEVAEAAIEAAAHPEQLRIAQLEAQLKEARRQKPLSWREQWRQLWDEVASGLGWAIVYFSLLPAWWGGQTVGKKLFGLRVVELTGQPMTVLRCLKRYGGYAAGMATGGMGFAQVLWDANRQALQDKAAHTVVLDLRAAANVPSVVVADDAQQP